LIASQRAVVKTIRNTESVWSEFLTKLGGGTEGKKKTSAFGTSTSLLPPGGVAMKPYGTENEFPVGLLWPLLER